MVHGVGRAAGYESDVYAGASPYKKTIGMGREDIDNLVKCPIGG